MFRLDDKVKIKQVVWEKLYPGIDNTGWLKIAEIYNDKHYRLIGTAIDAADTIRHNEWFECNALLPIPTCKDLDTQLCSICITNANYTYKYTHRNECYCSFFVELYSEPAIGTKDKYAARLRDTFLNVLDNDDMKCCFVAVLKKFYPLYYDVIEPYVTLV